MRICHITSMHPSDDDRIFERACRGLARAGHRVTLVATHPVQETIAGVDVVPLRQRRGLRRRLFSSWEAWRRAVKVDVDIYHFHDPDLFPWMLLLKRRGRPVVYDIHEYYVSRIIDSGLPRLLKRPLAAVYRAVENLLVSRFDGIVTVTGTMSDIYSHTNPRRVVVHNTVDLELLSHINISPQKEARPVIYTSGTNSLKRNCMQTVEALPLIAGEFPEVLMRFVGRYIPPGYEGRLLERARELGVEGKLELLGMLGWEENFTRTAGAHIGCVFYRDTANNRVTMPNRLFEYMFCGLPVLADDFPELRRVVEGSGCGLLVDSSSPGSIAEGALELLRKPEQAAEMGRRGRRAIEERYSFNRQLEALIEFYREVIDGRAGGCKADARRQEKEGCAA